MQKEKERNQKEVKEREDQKAEWKWFSALDANWEVSSFEALIWLSFYLKALSHIVISLVLAEKNNKLMWR